MEAEIIDEPDALEGITDAWDSLAVASARPFCAPAWMLAWWRNVAPPSSLLRVMVVRDAGRIVAVAPWWVDCRAGRPVRYRLLGSRTSTRREPLAVRGNESEAAATVAEGLARATPRPDLVELEGVVSESSWAAELRQRWPGRAAPQLHVERQVPAPVLALGGRSFEEWFGEKSSNFRQQMRKGRRDLEKAGATFRIARSDEELTGDLGEFARLHYSRWRSRGGSSGLDAAVERMLRESASELAPQRRFRLWSIDVDGKTISSQIFLEAGGEVAYWLGGFDEAWASKRPALTAILIAIEDAWETGADRVDLGVGVQDYKMRFADGMDMLEWPSLAMRGLRYPLTLAHVVPRRVARLLRGRLQDRGRGERRSVRAAGADSR